MPAIYKKVSASKFSHMICDMCESDTNATSDFVLRYTFGYGSPIDGDSVEAAICDSCLERIIKEHIPNAQWNNHE